MGSGTKGGQRGRRYRRAQEGHTETSLEEGSNLQTVLCILLQKTGYPQHIAAQKVARALNGVLGKTIVLSSKWLILDKEKYLACC